MSLSVRMESNKDSISSVVRFADLGSLSQSAGRLYSIVLVPSLLEFPD